MEPYAVWHGELYDSQAVFPRQPLAEIKTICRRCLWFLRLAVSRGYHMRSSTAWVRAPNVQEGQSKSIPQRHLTLAPAAAPPVLNMGPRCQASRSGAPHWTPGFTPRGRRSSR